MSDPLRITTVLHDSEDADLIRDLHPLVRKQRGRRIRLLLRLGLNALHTPAQYSAQTPGPQRTERPPASLPASSPVPVVEDEIAIGFDPSQFCFQKRSA
jgi:hypothetical protein